MVIPPKIKRRDIFSTRQHSYFAVTARTVKTRNFKLLYFRNETCYGNGILCKDSHFFIFNLVYIRTGKTSLFSLLMTSQWKPFIHPKCDFPLYGSAQRSFSPLQKSRRNHRSYQVMMVFLPAQKLSGELCTSSTPDNSWGYQGFTSNGDGPQRLLIKLLLWFCAFWFLTPRIIQECFSHGTWGRQRIFPFRKRSLPFLTVDATTGNQASLVMMDVLYSLD